MKGIGRACSALAAILFMSAAASAEDYPSQDVQMVVPWGAGGGTDAIVRKISAIAEKTLGGTVYVENIEGGISATGVMAVMSAKPNGYTVGALTYDSVVTVPWQKLLPTYKIDRLDLIARITSEPDAIIISKTAPYQDFQALIDTAKAKPGEIKVGIQNLGSRTHLVMLQLQARTGAAFDLIAYPGGAAPQKEALLSGEVDVVVTSLGDFSSLINEGEARGIVEFSPTRNPTFKDVPTAKEQGVDLQMGSFILLAAPAGTPEPIRAKLEAAYRAAYDSADFQSWLAEVGATPSWLGADDSRRWVAESQEMIFALMERLVAEGVINR